MKKMSIVSRILIAAGALVLIAVYFLPFWSIYLIAPQYPEGLSMQIWLYKLSGQVEIINGLNHYIGMKHIKEEMFPEFSYLVYIYGLFILMGIVVALIGYRKLLFMYLILLVIGGIAALWDFYQWGYDYGHDLDPAAAIQVPGLTYQPPLIGHKKLLNFDAFSYPDIGGWIVVGVVVLFILVWIAEKYIRPKSAYRMNVIKLNTGRSTALGFIILLPLVFSSCTPEPEKLVLGKDNCSECKMTIADPKFGGEIVTKKGRVYKFDDVHCIAVFLKNRTVELPDIHQTLFVNYSNNNEFIKAGKAEFVISSQLKSPMGGNAAAFPDVKSARNKSEELDGSRVTNWATLYNILIK